MQRPWVVLFVSGLIDFFFSCMGTEEDRVVMGNVSKQFPHYTSSTNREKLALIWRRVSGRRRDVHSSFQRLTTHLGKYASFYSTLFISSLPTLSFAVGQLAGSWQLPTDTRWELNLQTSEGRHRDEKLGRWEGVQILGLSLMLESCVKASCCSIIMFFL